MILGGHIEISKCGNAKKCNKIYTKMILNRRNTIITPFHWKNADYMG